MDRHDRRAEALREREVIALERIASSLEGKARTRGARCDECAAPWTHIVQGKHLCDHDAAIVYRQKLLVALVYREKMENLPSGTLTDWLKEENGRAAADS